MSKGDKLKVSKKLEQERLNRLRKFIDLKAPRFLIVKSAEQYLGSYRWSLKQTWMRYCPGWLLWLTSAHYRQIVRDDEF